MRTLRAVAFIFFSILLDPVVLAAEDGIKNLRETSKAFASVARSVSPSVVFIQVEGKSSQSTMPGFRSPFEDQWPFDDEL